MVEETWKKGGELIKNMPKLKLENEVEWEEGSGKIFMTLCELLKGNAVPTKKMDLSCDEKRKELL